MQNDKRLLRFDYEVSHICLWGFSDLIMRLLRIWLCRFRVLTNQAKKTRVDMFNLIQPTSKFIYTLHSLQFRIKTIQGYLQIYNGRQYEYNCKHTIKDCWNLNMHLVLSTCIELWFSAEDVALCWWLPSLSAQDDRMEPHEKSKLPLVHQRRSPDGHSIIRNLHFSSRKTLCKWSCKLTKAFFNWTFQPLHLA